METNYELKHKCLLVPLKAVLLVFAMLLVGFTTFAQSGKAVRVATNEQLTEAMLNPAVGTVELQPGYYAYLNYYANEGDRVVKAQDDNGNRETLCLFLIIGKRECFFPVTDPLDPLYGLAPIQVQATFLQPVPPCGPCCPPNHADGWGYWSVTGYAPGSTTVVFANAAAELTDAYVDVPGQYIFRYTWPDWDSHVETYYVLYDPVTVDLEADDVCEADGLSTDVTFTLDSDYIDPFYTVAWTLDGLPYAGPDESGTFPLNVSACGPHVLAVLVDNMVCPPVFEEITIWFDCEPIADAGPDISVCGDICTTLDGNVTVAIPHPQAYSWSWVNVSGPQGQTLSFSPNGGYMETDVTACRGTTLDPCPYGVYEVQLQVQNGMCYDDDNALVTFYQQPTADAGDPQYLCNTFTFGLDATPFGYCGVSGTNFWSTSYWEVVSKADPAAVIAFSPSANDPDATVTITSTAVCPFGEYTFKWVEKNGPTVGGCYAEDLVTVTIFEDPAPNAGPDLVFCNTFAFSLWGIGDAPCYENTVVEYSWEKTCQPGNCDVMIYDGDTPNPDIQITNCSDDPDVCNYGKYCFEFTQCNGYLNDAGAFEEVCCSTDAKEVWILEEAAADAGPDQHICYSFDIDLAAVPTDFCGDPGVNYFTWGVWEFVGGPSTATIAEINNPNSAVSIDNSADCPYGKYTFKWTEYNGFGTPFQGCWDVDYVDIYIDEVPVDVDAGDDLAFCDQFTFALDGTVDMPCVQTTAYSYTWSVVSQPDPSSTVSIDPYLIDPSVSITGGTGCKYGEYVFRLTQMNGYYNDAGQFNMVCSDFDEVSVWIFEPVDPDAGMDQYICNTFTFGLDATPTGPLCFPGYLSGEWSFVGGPAPVVITTSSMEDPVVTVQTAGIACPWGAYTFRYTEKNGFFAAGADPRGWCQGYDEVTVYIYEPLDVNAGNDAAYCDLFSFYLDGSLAPLCNTSFITQVTWSVVTQPDACDVTFTPAGSLDPMVSITNCQSCAYGDYIFKVRVENGYYDASGWNTVCFDEDEVTVTIYEHPDDVDAGDPQLLCNDFTFDLAADASDYCGANDPHYSWVLVSQPTGAGCTVNFTTPTLTATSVSVVGCTGPCPYGEFVFRFTEWNGPYALDCSSTDLVTVTIFEDPDADAGDDVDACVGPDDDLCYDMDADFDYCYSMMGLWTKSCGPGEVVFDDLNDPNAAACFSEPGRYKLTWTEWNGAENCEDADEVIFDLLEEPIASADAEALYAECNTLCIDLGLAGVNKYVYEGTDQGECPNYLDFAKWTVVSGPGTVTFDPDVFAPDADICVDAYGGYTLKWTETNMNVDGDFWCDDYVDIYVEFNETPEPEAVGGEICGNCFDLDGTLDGGFSGSTFYWEFVSGPCVPTFDPLEIDPEVCISDVPECYGTYNFILHQFNGECEGTATASITFKQLPPPVAICYQNNPNNCDEFGGNQVEFDYGGCLEPNDVFYTCADGWSYFSLNPWCSCLPGFDWTNPLLWGWTFEWSLIAPAGTEYSSQPGYYDFENGSWVYPYLNVNWGECCDTARIYLTITTDEDCELTLEYKAYVYHKPCVDIVGPEIAEVGLLELGVPYEYCNNCPPNPCLLYTWTAEPCGHIVYGQGTPCIGVEWDSYVINDGWGEITLTVFDTCTGCCNFDALPVKVYPSGTLGTAELSGYVLYHNNSETPLNGVEVQLWNGNVPVMSTVSFNDIEGGNGVGYYEFTNLSAVTAFGVSASHDAMWYGANATDALAVELRSIGLGSLPPGFVYDDVVEEAMNVNNSVTPLITSVDALWIKQRAINMVNYFPAGNWAFDQTMQTTATVGYDIYALNMGDANRSNIPNSNKAMSVDLVNDGMMNVVSGQVFDLPVRIAKADEFGAITLNLEYNPAMLEVVDVVAMEGMLSNITSNNVGIAWSNLNPMALADNDVVVTLKVKAIGEIASTETVLSVGYGSEFADPTANVVEPVTLKTFGITTEPAALDYFLSTNRPNPFSTSTFIEYTMPETGKVRLSVLDMLGQELAVLVDATQTAGSYTVEFSAAGLATGVYIYKITVDGESRDFISTQRMVVSH